MNGAILHVDMTTGTHRMIDDPELFGEFLGGTAVATELLFRHGDPQGDPLAPEKARDYIAARVRQWSAEEMSEQI